VSREYLLFETHNASVREITTMLRENSDSELQP